MEEEGKGKDSEGKKVCIIVAIATILHFVTSLSSASGSRERATSIFVVDQRDGRVERLLLRLSSLLPGQGKPGGCGHFPCLSYQTGGHLRQ